jgi:beta-aspartyl-peptidase (threonine type)
VARGWTWSTTAISPRRAGIEALASLKARKELGTLAKASEAEKHGTVGAVALDARGHLAAATSTGGFNNKPAGRVGDSPIIGAGTYARDGACAVSCTGQGEIFIRRAVGARPRGAHALCRPRRSHRAADALIHD